MVLHVWRSQGNWGHVRVWDQGCRGLERCSGVSAGPVSNGGPPGVNWFHRGRGHSEDRDFDSAQHEAPA